MTSNSMSSQDVESAAAELDHNASDSPTDRPNGPSTAKIKENAEHDPWRYLQRSFYAKDEYEWAHFTTGGLQPGHHTWVHRMMRVTVRYGPMALLATCCRLLFGRARNLVRESLAARRSARQLRHCDTIVAPIQQRRTVYGWPAIHPDSSFARYWHLAMLALDLTYTAFLVPIIIAFANDLLTWEWLNIIDVTGGSLYLLDVIMGFTIGMRMIWRDKEALVMDGVLVAEFYVTKASAVLDIIAALPTIPIIVLLCIPGFSSNTGSLVLNLLRLLRFVRLPRAFRMLYNFCLLVLLHVPPMLRGIVNAITVFYFNFLFFIAVLVNAIACLWYFMAALESQNDEYNWIEAIGLDEASEVKQYFASVNFAMATVTTIGYGNISPVNTTEYIISSGLMLVGVFVFGLLLSSLGDMFHRTSGGIRRAVALRDKLSNLEVWSSRRGFPPELLLSMRAYFIDTWPKVKEAEDEVTEFQHLPYDLRRRVAWHITAHVLQTNDVFRQLPEHLQESLSSRLWPMFVPRGVNLVSQGGAADCIWVLQEGMLRVLHNTREVDVIRAPCIVGQAALLEWVTKESQVRPATLRAATNCYLWRLSLDDLVPLLEGHPPMVCHMAEYFAERISGRLKVLGREDQHHAMWARLHDELKKAAAREQQQTNSCTNAQY